MAFDIQGAREAGYSDDEIADHLSKKAGLDIEAARRAGYETREILAELSKAWAKQDLPAGVKESDAGAGRGSVAPTDAAIPKPTPAKGPTLADLKQGPGAVLENVRQAARPADRIGKGGAPEQKPVIGRDPLSSPNPDFTPGPADLQAGQVSDERALREAKQRAYVNKTGAPDAQAPSADTLLGESVAGVSSNPLYRGVAGGVSNLAQTGIGAVRAGADALGLDGVAEFAQGASRKAGAVERAATADLKGNNKLAADIFASITASAPSMAVGMIGGPGLKTLFAQSALAEYNTGRNAGFSEAESATRAGIFGMAEALGERFGFPQQIQLLKSIGKHVPTSELGKVAAEMLAKEIPGEQLTTAMQFMADKFGPAAQNPNATLSDYLDQAGETLKVTIGQSALMGGGPVAISKAKDTYRAADKAIGGDTATPMDAEALAKSKGFLDDTRPADIRTEAFKRLDDVGAKHGIPSNVLGLIKKAADGKPVEDLTGWMRRALTKLSQTGDIAPVDDATLSLLDQPTKTDTPPSGPAPQGAKDGNAEKPGPGQTEAAPMDFSGLADETTPAPPATIPIEGESINRNWSAFTPESGSLGIPREQMPQIKAEHRGALTNFLKARDITVDSEEVPADSLKPTQAEFSPRKVQQAKDFTGGDRAILVSHDGYVIDGHHQWLAKREAGQPVKVMRIGAPVQDILRLAHQFPSSTSATGPAPTPTSKSVEQQGANDGQGQEGRRQEVLTAAPAVGVTYKAPDGRTLRIYVSTPNRVGVADEKGNKSSIARGSPGWAKMEQAIAASQPKTETVPQPAPAEAQVSQPNPAEAIPAADLVEAAAPAEAPAPAPKTAKRPKLRNHPDTVRGSNALAEISRALGGISPDIISDLSQKTTRTRTSSKTGKKTIFTTWDNPAIPGVGPLFRRGGTSDLTEIARVLEDAGYIEAGLLERDYLEARSRAQDIVKAELADGGSSLRIGDPDAIEAEMRRRAEMDAPPETPDSFDDAPASTWADDWLSPDDQEATGYTSLDPDVQAAVDALLDEAEALGIDRESLIEDAARQTADLTEKDYRDRLQQLAQEAIARARGEAVQADAAAARAGDQGGGSDAQAPGRSGGDRADGSDQAVRSEGEAEGLTGQAKQAQRLIANYRKKWGVVPRGMDRQQFRDFHDARREAERTIDQNLLSLARDGDGLLVPSKHGSGFVSLHLDPRADGAWRITRFTADMEPSGHMEFATPSEAAASFRSESDVPGQDPTIDPLIDGTDEGFSLQQETEAEAQAKAEREAQALADERRKREQEQARLEKEAADREAKARADATVADFQLGQSADQQLSGMADLFAEPAQAGNDLIGFSQQEAAQATKDVETLRRSLIDLENRIVGAAGMAPDMLEDALRSRKVPAAMKQRRDALREQLRAAREQADRAQEVQAPAREKRADGRTIPQAGDKVYTETGGFGGMPATVRGEVRNGASGPFVAIEGAEGMLGERAGQKRAPLTAEWTLMGEEHPNARNRRESAERIEADSAKRKADREAMLTEAAARNGTLDPATVKVGDVLELADGTRGTITDVERFGIFVDGRSIGNDMRGIKKVDAAQSVSQQEDPATPAKQAPSKPVTTKAEAGDSEEVRQAKVDALKALADLGDLLGGPKAMMLPEQEQKLLPVLTRLFDAAFRLGYLKFKDAAKWSLDQIRSMLGDGAADQITLDHLQGAYIGMAGKYRDRGADKPAVVAAVESLDEITAEMGRPKADGVTRAVAGGQMGVNGEWYEGGQILPTSEDTIKGEHTQPSGPRNEPALVPIEQAKDTSVETTPAATLAGSGLVVEQKQSQKGKTYWTVTGNTRDHEALLDALGFGKPFKMGGKWYRSVFDADPTERLAAALQGNMPAAEPKADLPSLPADEATAVLRQAKVEVSQVGDAWIVTGKTFDIKDAIKSVGGKWNGKAWAFSQDPSGTLAAAIKERGGAGASGDDAGTGESDAEVARRIELRQREDARPDERGDAGNAAELVGQDTRDLILRGRQFNIPESVLNDQIEDIGLIVNAHAKQKPLFLLANEAGTGKTLVLGGAIRELRKRGETRFVYVTMNTDLIAQIQRDLADYGTQDVDFHTYSELSAKGFDTDGAVLIFDEAHNVKNVGAETARANKAQELIGRAKMTLFASATLFENPVEARYLGATGIFDSVGGFNEWAKMYGAAVKVRKFYNPNTGRNQTEEIIYWTGGKAKRADGAAARAWLFKQAVMTQRAMKIDPSMVDVQFRRAPVDQKWVELYQQVSDAYDAAEDAWKDENGNPRDAKIVAEIARHRENTIKRVLEASKIPFAITEAQDLLKAGRNVVVFVETKADRHLGRWKRSEHFKDDTLYDFGQMQEMMAEWRMEEGMARMQREKAPPKPFADFIYEVARYFDAAGIDSELPSTSDEITAALGADNVAIYTGAVSNGTASKNKADFMAGRKRVLVATMAKGGTGLSLHDTKGNRPTTQLNINLPWKATGVDQVSARVARYGLASKAEVRWLFASNIPWESTKLAPRVGARMRDMGAIVKGMEVKAAEVLDGQFDFEGDIDVKGGAAIAAGATMSIYERAKRMEAMRRKADDTSHGFFETPYPLAALMANVAGVQPGQRLLEPSGGRGNLLRLLPEGVNITAVELRQDNREALSRLLPGAEIHAGDFMEWNGGGFDTVLMNPPFERKEGVGAQDVAHVQRAYEMLGDGGRLVAIMGEGAFFREFKQEAAFRAWLDDVGATVVTMPEGAFKQSGTGVRTRMVVIDKNGEPGRTDLDLHDLEVTSLQAVERQIPSRAAVALAESKLSDATEDTSPTEAAPTESTKTDAAEVVQDAETLPPAPLDAVTIEDITESAAQEEAAITQIADFGQKIGGARKDTARATGSKAKITGFDEEDAGRPTWARKYVAMPIRGQVSLMSLAPGAKQDPVTPDTPGAKWGLFVGKSPFMQRIGRFEFDTREDAEAFIPIAEVGRKHRVSPYKEGDKTVFGIFRKMGERKRALVRGGFGSEAEGMTAMVEDATSIIEHRFPFPERPWLDGVQRIGAPRRTGHVTIEEFDQAFGFRGVEFGKWNMSGDGQATLNHAYDALMDLADALGIPPRALSLNGELAVAFGARGQGGKGFKAAGAAHYEPDYEVINMTKEQGAGSLAHEWFHALDHYLARLDNAAPRDFTTNERGDKVRSVPKGKTDIYLSGVKARRPEARKELIAAFRGVIDALQGVEKQVPVNVSGIEKRLADAKATLDYRLNDLRGWLTDGRYNRGKKTADALQMGKWDDLAEALRRGQLGADVLIGPNGELAPDSKVSRMSMPRASSRFIVDMNLIYKAVTGRSFDKTGYDSTGARLKNEVQHIARLTEDLKRAKERSAAGMTDTVTRSSEFYQNARDIDGNRVSAYWSTPHEMAARGFEAFIMDRLAERAGRNDYLVYGAENRYYALYGMKPYPEGDERKAINAAFGRLFKAIQTKDDDKGNVAMLSRPSPTYFSALQRAAEASPMKAGDAGAWRQWLKGITSSGKAKAEEIAWSGLEEWLQLQPGKITKAQVVDYLAANGVRVEEVTLGAPDYSEVAAWWNDEGGANEEEPFNELSAQEQQAAAERYAEEVGQYEEGERQTPKYAQYTLPGGTAYREVLLTLPVKPRDTSGYTAELVRGPDEMGLGEWQVMSGERFVGNAVLSYTRENAIQTAVNRESREKPSGYKSAHWEQSNILAHIRLNDRTDADGKRVLFVEEIQSDAAQDKRRGKTDFKAPFIDKTDAWVALALKRVIKLAVDGGYDKVAFVTGEQSAERYDLSKQVQTITWADFDQGTMRSVTIDPIGGSSIEMRVDSKGLVGANKPEFDGKRLDEVVGKEVADKIMSSSDGMLTGEGLRVGGEGMRAFYDKIVPSVAKDVLRKVGGGQLGTVQIANPEKGRDVIAQQIPGNHLWGLWDNTIGRWVDMDGNPLSTPDGNLMSEKAAKSTADTITRDAKRPDLTQTAFDITPAMREAAAGGLPLFKRAQAANDAGLSASDLQPVADALTSNGVKATVLPSRDQLPPAALAEVKTVDPTGIARGALTSDGQIWLFANRLGSHAEALEVALHEGFHRGLRLLGDKGSKVLAQVYATNAKVRKLADAYQKDYPDLDREDATNEALADLAGRGEAEKLNYWAALKRLVRDFLRRVADAAGIKMEWTDADVTRFVASMSRKGLTNGAHADGGAQLAAGVDQTQTEAFRRWFGDSKVVDAEGKPMVVYHGAKAGGDFSVFLRSGYGYVYTTSDSAYASSFGASGSVYPVFLSVKNPLDARRFLEKDIATAGWEAFLKENGVDTEGLRLPENGLRAAWQWIKDDQLKYKLQDAGFDGVRMFENDDSSEVFVAFEPEQIKSAIGNRGTFDPAHPDIRLSRPPRHTPEEQAALAKAGITPGRTIKQAVQGAWNKATMLLRNRAYLKLVAQQATLDQFVGIKDVVQRELGGLPVDQDPYITARLANGGAASVMHALLLHGQAKWASNKQHLEKIDGTRGLLDILAPLGDDLNDWFGWMVGNRAERLKREGRENNLTDADIKALQGLASTPEKLAKFRAAAVEYAAFKRSVLDIAEGAGLIDPAGRKVWDHADYIPFYRQIDERSTFTATGKKGLAGQSSGIRVLKGGEAALNDPMENLLMNFSRLIDASLKNNALRKTIDAVDGTWLVTKVGYEMTGQIMPKSQVKKILEDAGTPPDIIDVLPDEAFDGMAKIWAIQAPTDPDVVRVMVGGKPQFYRVDEPILLRSLTSFVPFDMPGLAAARMFKRLLTSAVTSTPDFLARNFIRDSLATRMISRDAVTVGSAIRGLGRSFAEKGAGEAMLFAGASFQGGQVSAGNIEGSARTLRRALRRKGIHAGAAGKAAVVIDSPARLWDFWTKARDATENANREAVYEAALKAGRGETLAAFEAKDLMDFSLRGGHPLYQVAADVLPFFNARMQGLYRLARVGGPDAAGKAALRKFATYAVMMAILSAVLAAINAGRDDYNRLPDWEKDTYWHLFVGGQHFKVPKPFELGAMFGSLPERITRYLMGVDTGHKLGQRIGAILHDQLAVDLVPQMIRPALDVYANWDAFRDRPIETTGDEGKIPSQRFDARTSPTATAAVQAVAPLADRVGLSPKRLEYLIGGYLGTVGTYALGGVDIMVRGFSDGAPTPAWRADDIPVVKSFYAVDPARSTVYESDLYAMREEIEKVYKSINASLAQGDEAGAALLRQRFSKELEARPAIKEGAEDLATIRRDMNAIYADPRLTPKQKRELIDQLQVDRNKVAEETMMDPAVRALR